MSDKRPRPKPEFEQGKKAADNFRAAMSKMLSVSKDQLLELEKKSGTKRTT